MLNKIPELISPATLQLIQQLQVIPALRSFHLVGGTALSLQIGHRNSIDIDLFTIDAFETTAIAETVRKNFEIEIDFEFKNSLLCRINSIKVDFITHNYPYIKPPVTEEGITYLSREDIAAMKLNAIIQSGKRLKDFIDIWFLLEHFSMEDMLRFFGMKYSHVNPVIALRAVNYFNDIDESFDPPKLLKPLPLEKIKKRIQDATLHSKKVF